MAARRGANRTVTAVLARPSRVTQKAARVLRTEALPVNGNDTARHDRRNRANLVQDDSAGVDHRLVLSGGGAQDKRRYN